MLSPLPALLTPGNMPLPEAAAPSRDASGGNADFAMLMQRQSDRQAALREIDQQVASKPRPSESARAAEATAVPRPAAERSARQGEPEPDHATRAETAKPDSHPQPANGKPEAARTGQEDGTAPAEPPTATSADGEPAHAATEPQVAPPPRRAAGASDQQPATPRQPVDRAANDGPADGAPADATVPAGVASTPSTTQWARSRLASRAAASGLPDLTAHAAGNRPAPADLSDPPSDALATNGSISTTNLAASLAPTALPTPPPPLPWPTAQPLQPATTAASTTGDAGLTAVAATVSAGAVALPTGADLPAVTVTAAAAMPGGMGPLVADALRVPTAPHPASTLPDAAPTQATGPNPAAASLTQVTMLPNAEPTAITPPIQAATANPGPATAAPASTAATASTTAAATAATTTAESTATPVTSIAAATAATPTAKLATSAAVTPAATTAATAASTATSNARLSGRAVGELASRGRETDPRATTRSISRAADTPVAGIPTPAADGSTPAAAAAAASTITVQPAETTSPSAMPPAVPAGQPPAAAARPAATDSTTARVDLGARIGAGATPSVTASVAAPVAMATADRASGADNTKRTPATSPDTTRRDETGLAAAGNPAAPAPAGAVPAPPAVTSTAAAANADRAAQAVAGPNQAPSRTEAVADLASSFNALPLAAQGTTPVVSPGNSAAAPAEARVPVPLDDPAFGAALGTQVSVMVRDGVQTARLQLNPPEMGPIAVQIALDGSAARVDFQADLAGTRAVIEASLPALAGALQDAGFTLAGGGVFQQTPGRQGQGDQPANPGQARQADGNSAAGNTLPAAPGMQRTQRGLVDLVA